MLQDLWPNKMADLCLRCSTSAQLQKSAPINLQLCSMVPAEPCNAIEGHGNGRASELWLGYPLA